jgi:hypothetical protein
MKGFKLVWSLFKTLSIIEYRVIINTDLFDLVLQFAGSLAALQDLLHLLFRLLVVDYRQ